MQNDAPPVFDVLGYIRRAAGDDKMREHARLILAEMITRGDLLAYQGRKPEVRPSDFGDCTLALQASIQGKETLPRDPIEDQLLRLDLGSLIGAWEACLLKVACTQESLAILEMGTDEPSWSVWLEYQPLGGGHIDAFATQYDRRGQLQNVVVEFKSQYDTSPPKNPQKENLAHCLQSSDYATREDVSADTAILVYVKPCAPKGKRAAQFAFDPKPYKLLVAEERARLERALLPEKAPADPQARYSCWTCQFGDCEKNKNKAAESPDLLFA